MITLKAVTRLTKLDLVDNKVYKEFDSFSIISIFLYSRRNIKRSKSILINKRWQCKFNFVKYLLCSIEDNQNRIMTAFIIVARKTKNENNIERFNIECVISFESRR